MELSDIHKEISEIEDFRWKYFDTNPEATENDRTQAVEGRIVKLLEIVENNQDKYPLIEFNRACGRICNLFEDYSPRGFWYLGDVAKADPTSESWCDVAIILAKMKEVDFEGVVECLENSLLYGRTAPALVELSTALRHMKNQERDATKRKEMELKSAELAEEAVKVDANYGKAHMCLGNSLLFRFFGSPQVSLKLLDEAVVSYKRGLKCEHMMQNPDLHLNLATALRFEEDYAGSLKHFELAAKYDPSNVVMSHTRLEALKNYLRLVAVGVENKGKLKTRRVNEILKAMKIVPFGKKVTTSFNQLAPGCNPGKAVFCTVFGDVRHSEQVPYTFIAGDRDGEVFAVTVYNCSANFSYLIGDTIGVADPHLSVVENVKVSDKQNISFRCLTVRHPIFLQRNGEVKLKEIAQATLKIDEGVSK